MAVVTKGAGSLTLAGRCVSTYRRREESLAIRYKAKVSTNETMTNMQLAATVIFTIAAVAEEGLKHENEKIIAALMLALCMMLSLSISAFAAR